MQTWDASFPAAAPDLWNILTFTLREMYNEDAFKSALKHYSLNYVLIAEVTLFIASSLKRTLLLPS